MSNIIRRTAETSWHLNSGLGSHRAVVRVNNPGEVVLAEIEWRRRDAAPEETGVRIIHLATNKEVKGIYILEATHKTGKIIFKAQYEGFYGVYYMPFVIEGAEWYFPEVRYMKAGETAYDETLREIPENELTRASLVAIESRTDFDRFSIMEVAAACEEVQKLIEDNAEEAFLLFPEDRLFPIRMLDNLPQRWIDKGPGLDFKGKANPGEYYVFQIGVWALEELTELHVAFESAGEVLKLPASAITCFNTEGRDWLVRDFTKRLRVKKGSVQPLWFGVDLMHAAAGQYGFSIKIKTSCRVKTVQVELAVEGEILPDNGDGDLWRLSRLRWLNSAIGMDNETAKGYPPVEVDGKHVLCLGREAVFNDFGLPASIQSFFSSDSLKVGSKGEEIISGSVEMRVVSGEGAIQWVPDGLKIEKIASGCVSIESDISSSEGLKGSVQSIMEYDGHIDTVITLLSDKDLEIADFQLLVPIRKEVAAYFMGMGRQGGARPAQWQYIWDIDRANNMLWMGVPHAGIQIKLKHTEDVWDTINYRKDGLPEAWYNDGKGGCSITEKEEDVLFDAFTGARVLRAGESMSWRFSLLITPLKSVNSDAHWNQRYYHVDTWSNNIPSLEEAAEVGASIVNLHQGGPLNPYINYPFLQSKELKKHSSCAHAMGLKYKIYYTVRELSSHAVELWMLRSLGDEVLSRGEGFRVADHFSKEKHSSTGGGPWMCEHLVDGYTPAWQQLLNSGDYDSAVGMTGLSRWHNHYLEGLAWLMREADMDGVYLDGIGYDRQVMKRVRKTMDRAGDGCLIDFHSGNNFELHYGLGSPMNSYLELMPSIDSLWLGENYDYENTSPEYMLIEISGIPFGLMGDMLNEGGNPWRGMVFGMTCRYGWTQGGNPVPLWHFWKSFGMVGSRMYGWWSEDCPVKTGNKDIKATAFIKPDKTLVAIASWAKEAVHAELLIDWGYLGIKEADAVIEAPEIEDFQAARVFMRGEGLMVEPGRGWLVVLSSERLKL